MKTSIKKGLGFGLTSGVVTTLGLIVGLGASKSSEAAIIGGIIIIAFADALSDSLGMHLSEEANPKTSERNVWESTFSTLVFKLFVAGSFIVPFVFFSEFSALVVCVLWGVVLLSVFSYSLARARNQKVTSVIGEHLGIMVLVILISYGIGRGVALIFGL